VASGSRTLREFPIAPGRLEGHGRRGKPLTADYVLVHRNRKLAVIEAKACDKPRTKGVAQAKNYAGKLAVRFAYASFWHPYGTPMSAQQFMESLFGELPDFFADEAELRELCSRPDTRKKLLAGLAEKGFGGEQLVEMQRIIDAEKSDLFDVLAHVACALPPETREERASRARLVMATEFTDRQQAFLDFVLSHYVSEGVGELDQEKLAPLLKLCYQDSFADAVADLGSAVGIGKPFAGFQKYLYLPQSLAAA
jgi:hypothetical protein